MVTLGEIASVESKPPVEDEWEAYVSRPQKTNNATVALA
jgi:hypothetical protein